MIDMALGGPPQGLMNKLRTLGRLAHIGAYQPPHRPQRALPGGHPDRRGR